MIFVWFKSSTKGAVLLYGLLIAVHAFTAFPVYADIVNPSFELFEYHADPNFSKPFCWEIENYAADVNNLMPLNDGQGEGGYQGWPDDIKDNGLFAIDGERLLMLSTGHIGEPGDTDHGKAWQHITAQEGDRLSGYYFFGTCDYIDDLDDYNDYATITLVRNPDPNDNIELIYINVSDVGNYSSMGGWERFEYIFSAETAGECDLTFHVQDAVDDYVNSYLGIDDLELCAAPEHGDINLDCQADYLDFAIIAQFWQINCYGPPGDMSDPNRCDDWAGVDSPGDFDDNEIIDVNDLKIFASEWLTGE
ncbi:MAG: hypothetical protein JW912_00885 [Sedimentisphaerales bacterium]|nr:hypothetical protein [Sedimentisphaerales bacterium]